MTMPVMLDRSQPLALPTLDRAPLKSDRQTNGEPQRPTPTAALAPTRTPALTPAKAIAALPDQPPSIELATRYS